MGTSWDLIDNTNIVRLSSSQCCKFTQINIFRRCIGFWDNLEVHRCIMQQNEHHPIGLEALRCLRVVSKPRHLGKIVLSVEGPEAELVG